MDKRAARAPQDLFQLLPHSLARLVQGMTSLRECLLFSTRCNVIQRYYYVNQLVAAHRAVHISHMRSEQVLRTGISLWWAGVLVIAIMLCLCTSAIAEGTTGPISTFNIGPEGGVFWSLVADSQHSGTLYAGSQNAGVFKTTNGGANWSSAGLAGFAVVSLAIDQNDSTIYAIAGLWNLYDGLVNSRVFRSNGGANWTAVTSGLPSSACWLSNLVSDPQHSGTLYVIACGSVFKSTDSGDTWNPASSGLMTNMNFRPFLAIAPQASNILYVVTSQCDQSGTACDSRIFRSVDGGENWTEATSTPLVGIGGPLVVDPQDNDTLYLNSSTYGNNGVSKSIDGGRTWTTPTAYGYPVFSSHALAIDPRDPNTIYASSVGLFKSTDGAQSWSVIYTTTTFAAIVVDPQTPGTIFGAGAGIVKSTDDGAHWAALHSGLRAMSITAAAIDPQSPDTLYAARCCVVEAGDLSLFKSTDKGKTWAAVGAGLQFDVYANEVVTLAIDPQTPSNLYAGVNGDGGCGGLFKSVDGGMTWGATGPAYSCPVAVVIDPQSPSTVYAGTWDGGFGYGVLKSIDAGATWTSVGFGGSRSAVSALALDPQDSQTLYAGIMPPASRNSTLFKSTDGGSTWTSLPLSSISAIAVDPQNSHTVYAVTTTVCCFLWGEAGGNLWKSVDGGASWQDISASLPGRVTNIAIDPRKPATIYAATNVGVIKSTDGGETWAPLASNIWAAFLLPDPKSDDTLYAGGPGGLFEVAPSTVTSITFDVAVVRIGASFTATIAGSNLGGMYFDVQVRPPGSAADIVVLNWQTGTTESHSVQAGIDIGTWIVTGVRAHQDPEDHTGGFVPVSATITVSP